MRILPERSLGLSSHQIRPALVSTLYFRLGPSRSSLTQPGRAVSPRTQAAQVFLKSIRIIKGNEKQDHVNLRVGDIYLLIWRYQERPGNMRQNSCQPSPSQAMTQYTAPFHANQKLLSLACPGSCSPDTLA